MCASYCFFCTIALCFFGSLVSLRGILAGPEELRKMSRQIGTKNPVLAKIVCWIGLLVCTPLAVGATALVIWMIVKE